MADVHPLQSLHTACPQQRHGGHRAALHYNAAAHVWHAWRCLATRHLFIMRFTLATMSSTVGRAAASRLAA